MSSPFLPPQSLEPLRGCPFKRGNGSFSFFLGQLHEMLPKKLANGFRRLFETQLLRFLFACLQNQPPNLIGQKAPCSATLFQDVCLDPRAMRD
jgi:hypothetical protein